MALFLSRFVNKVTSQERVSRPGSFRAASGPAAILAFRPQLQPYAENDGQYSMEWLSNDAKTLDLFRPEQEEPDALSGAEAPWAGIPVRTILPPCLPIAPTGERP